MAAKQLFKKIDGAVRTMVSLDGPRSNTLSYLLRVCPAEPKVIINLFLYSEDIREAK